MQRHNPEALSLFSRVRLINKPPNKFKPFLTLTLAGLFSGFLTLAAMRLLEFLFLGAVFGLVIAGYFWFRGLRSVWKMTGFVAACTVAHAVAMTAGSKTAIPLEFLRFVDLAERRDIEICFTGGLVGAPIVLAAFCLFVAPQREWERFLLKAFAVSVLSGVLGIVGWELGASLGTVLWHSLKFVVAPHQTGPSGTNLYSLYVVWQTGMALLLAFLLPRQAVAADVPFVRGNAESLDTARSERKLSFAAKLFFASVLVALGYFTTGRIQEHRSQQRYRALVQEAQTRALTEAPSMEKLPKIEPLPTEQVLVLKPIAGHSWNRPYVQAAPAWTDLTRRLPPIPPRISYMVGYGAQPAAHIEVILYPNAEWAKYELRNISTPNAGILEAKHISTVTKFGNNILMRTEGQLFYWPSGNKVVQIRFNGPEEDEFLEEYLKRHPSSL